MDSSTDKSAALSPLPLYHRAHPESMPAIYQRLRHTLRRRPRQSQQVNNAVVPRNRREQPQNANYPDDENDNQDGGRSSPPPLPVITDRGPLCPNRYGNKDVFRNSAMMEANKKDKTWLSPSMPGKLLPQDEYTGRSRLPKYDFVRYPPPANQPGNSHEPGSKPFQSRAATVRRKLATDYTSRNDERKILYGRERAENDLTVMYYVQPGYSQTPSVTALQQRLRSPRPADASDTINDLNSLYNSPLLPRGTGSEQHSASVEYLPTTPRPPTINEEDGHLHSLLHAYYMPDPSTFPHSITSPTIRTWNSALNTILHRETVDPNMKQQVMERVENNTTVNGYGEGQHFHVTTIEAGVVPNFSDLVAGSAFYHRTVADATLVPSANDELIDGPMEAEDVEREHQLSIETSRLQDFDFGFALPNGVSSPSFASLKTYITTSPSSLNKSTSPTTALLSRQSSSTDADVSNRLNALLTNVLSQSELSLLNGILATPPDTQTSSPVFLRLTHSLHALLFHLQDRTLYLEDNLLPQLGAALERKTYTIDVLSLEIRNLGDQITQLKATVDFSTSILAGCWMREYEMWRTLTGIREGRRRWWNLRRSRVPECVLSPDSGQKLSGRELDTMVLMAEQNVGVLREDVEDMVEKVEGCKRNFGAGSKVEVEEGSWRDV
jgi:hypothetical protein